ncbi:MAG TPA: 30S ribosomal protein S3 [Spirochaetota bacterium]|nr:30S ribosomal protein S3 [Spirochaetota bacterium]
MGQKVNPIGLRLGINKSWDSRWYSKKDYAKNLHEDIKIREYLDGRLKGGEVSKVEIIRYPEKLNIIIHTARPGIVIGRKGAEVENISKELQKYTDKNIQIKIKEIKNPQLDAKLIAENIARQLVGRVAFRRAMKRAISNAMQGGARGIKVRCAGRLGGAEMARSEHYKEGMIPLHTFRADIDYGLAEAKTTFGAIGVKVWVYKGEIFRKDQRQDAGVLIKKKRLAKET